MEMTREAREATTRETETRMAEDFTFEEPDALGIPEAVTNRFADEGLTLRWLRVSLGGKDDISNIGKRVQDGWQFVLPEEVPEMVHDSFVREEGRYSGTVSRGDLALGKIPTARANARKEYFENKSREMMDAVNSQLENHQDSRMPITNTSKTAVMKGRTPRFQD